MKKKGNVNLKLFTSRVTVVLILVFFVSTIGATYAYFYFSDTNSNIITGNMSTVNLELSVNKVLPPESDNTGVMVPQLPGNPLQSAIRNSCVDSNGNVVCQVYSINFNNNSSANIFIDGKVSFYSDSSLTQNSYTTMPNLRWMIINTFNSANVGSTVLGNGTVHVANSNGSSFIEGATYNAGQSNTYYIVVWFNENDSDQIDAGQTYYGVVDVSASDGTGLTAAFSGYASVAGD